MGEILPCGIPTISKYSRLLESERFAKLERYSNQFIKKHQDVLHLYAKKWVSDPFHQWSRQWEYPFVLDQIYDYCQTNEKKQVRILDAGSGLTFFPYTLHNYFTDAVIDCCDYDPELATLHSSIARTESSPLQFQQASLDHCNYDDNTFDFIYCISVMEHTDNYKDIVAEFYRLLKPGGRLIVTFDISIDGRGDISPSRAEQLCQDLGASFEDIYPVAKDFSSLPQKEDIVTTLYAASLNSKLLPWQRKPRWTRQLKSLVSHGRFISWPPPFTFCCLSFQR